MKKQLLACPFCGEIPNLIWNEAFWFWQIDHEKDSACIGNSMVPTANGKRTTDKNERDAAIMAWNKRV